MVLVDVNVLVYAFREEFPAHKGCRSWLEAILNGPEAFGLSDLVLAGFLRIVTHPKILDPPGTFERALAFVDAIRGTPHAVPVVPGPRHWEIFTKLCREAGAKGGLVQDAYFAALAIESGCDWVTTDRDFSRFPGLRWRHPLK